MEETVSLEPQDAQPAPEPTSRKDSKGYKVAKTAVTFSLLGIIVLCVLISLLCYIGVPSGISENGLVYKDTNVFKFAFDKEGGLLEAIKQLMDVFTHLSGSGPAVMMSLMISMYMIYGLLAGVLAVLIMSIVTLIKAIIHGVKKDTEKLTLDLMNVAKMNLTIILMIKLFTVPSEGGANYQVGGGIIASLVISLVALLAIAVVNFIFFKDDIHKANKYKQVLRSLSTCVLQLIIFAVLAATAYFVCFSEIFEVMAYIEISLPTDLMMAASYNMIVFVLVIVIISRVSNAIVNSLKYLCTLNDTPSIYEKKGSSGFIGAAVMTLISFVLLLLAKDYAGVESGYLIGACVVAIVGEVCYILLNKLDLFKEEVPASVPEATPAAESNVPSDDNTTNS